MKSICLDLRPYLNNRGFTLMADHKAGALSLGSASLPAEFVTFDAETVIHDIPFVFQQTDQFDNIEMAGQRIHFPETLVKSVHLLGVASNGDLFETVTFQSDEQPVQRSRVYFTDFFSSEPAFRDRLAITFPYAHSRRGKNENVQPTIWYDQIEFAEPVSCNGIEFEDNPFIHIFAITLGIA